MVGKVENEMFIDFNPLEKEQNSLLHRTVVKFTISKFQVHLTNCCDFPSNDKLYPLLQHSLSICCCTE